MSRTYEFFLPRRAGSAGLRHSSQEITDVMAARNTASGDIPKCPKHGYKRNPGCRDCNPFQKHPLEKSGHVQARDN